MNVTELRVIRLLPAEIKNVNLLNSKELSMLPFMRQWRKQIFDIQRLSSSEETSFELFLVDHSQLCNMDSIPGNSIQDENVQMKCTTI